MSSGEIAAHLRRLYDEVLGIGTFPTGECRAIRMSDSEHLDLVMWLADIAGIASHGEGLFSLTHARRDEFLRMSSASFLKQHPRLVSRIQAEKTPRLLSLIQATEEARVLIEEFLHSTDRRDPLSG